MGFLTPAFVVGGWDQGVAKRLDEFLVRKNRRAEVGPGGGWPSHQLLKMILGAPRAGFARGVFDFGLPEI